ncbi:MAG: TrkH family potassium uptake protein, partial [Chlamydiae bacterium]|nr:TrkH family potassium uptake protein [Chlamydiota bacterium]
IGSINFALYYHCLKGKFFRVYEPDFFLYVAILVTSIILVCLFLLGTSIITLDGKNLGPYTFTRALRDSSFQVISAETSTGFATVDIVRWPMITQLILFVIMYIGGMSGSTAGGIKTSRIYILYKIIVHKIEEIFRPDSIHRLKIGSKEIDHKAQTTVLVFFCIVTFVTLTGTILMILDNVDVETALGTVACMLNNVGFGFQEAGPSHSFAFLSATNKILSSFWMLLGRLEYFVVLLLFIPGFWRSK